MLEERELLGIEIGEHRADARDSSECGSDYGRIDYYMAHAYDPATSTWSSLPSMRLARSWHSSTLLPNGRALIAGGRYWTQWGNSESFAATASTELFSPPGTQGASCASSAECAGRPCVEGVCCDTACDGACEASSVAAGAAQHGACGPTTGPRCDDGDTCTEADACQAGVCVGVPSDVGSCHGGGGSGGGGSTSSGAGGDDEAGSATSSSGAGGIGAGDGGSGSATSASGGDASSSTSASSAGSGGGGSSGATAASSSSGADSSGDTGVATIGSASSSGSGANGGDTDSYSSGCSTNGNPTPAGTTANAAWLGALGLLCWSRRCALEGRRHH